VAASSGAWEWLPRAHFQIGRSLFDIPAHRRHNPHGLGGKKPRRNASLPYHLAPQFTARVSLPEKSGFQQKYCVVITIMAA
jgi:hypothetical protein